MTAAGAAVAAVWVGVALTDGWVARSGACVAALVVTFFEALDAEELGVQGGCENTGQSVETTTGPPTTLLAG